MDIVVRARKKVTFLPLKEDPLAVVAAIVDVIVYPG
jgi:hypothetical protein